MNNNLRIVGAILVGWIGLAASCTGESAPMLHRMTSYAGVVTITPEGGSERGLTLAYDLAFDRLSDHLQVKMTLGKRVVSLLAGTDGEPTAFEDSVERPATKAEVARFELVRDLTDLRALESLRRGVATYSVQWRGSWYGIELESQTGTTIHGHPR